MYDGNRLDGIECSWARSIGMPVTRVGCTCECYERPYTPRLNASSHFGWRHDRRPNLPFELQHPADSKVDH